MEPIHAEAVGGEQSGPGLRVVLGERAGWPRQMPIREVLGQGSRRSEVGAWAAARHVARTSVWLVAIVGATVALWTVRETSKTNWHHEAVVATPTVQLTMAGLRSVKQELADVALRRGATNLRVFGSVARNEASTSSDLDLLVDLEPGRSLVDLGGLVMDLAEFLGVDVDVVTEASLKPRLRSRVLAEAVPL